jgi:hypothetical protein
MPELRGDLVEAAYAPPVTAAVLGIHTLCTLLHMLEMYFQYCLPVYIAVCM